MQKLNLVGNKTGSIQEMTSTEVDAVAGATLAAYGAAIGVAAGIYKAGESIGSSMGHALYNLTHR